MLIQPLIISSNPIRVVMLADPQDWSSCMTLRHCGKRSWRHSARFRAYGMLPPWISASFIPITGITDLSKACPDSFHLCSTLYALAAYYQLFSWHSVNKLACWNRSPASSHLVDDDPNHPTDDEPFFSAFANSSSPLDGIVYSVSDTTLRKHEVVTHEVASGDPR
jgi:hypothetical protein